MRTYTEAEVKEIVEDAINAFKPQRYKTIPKSRIDNWFKNKITAIKDRVVKSKENYKLL